MMERISVDRGAFERLVTAGVAGDADGCRDAIDEMALAMPGDHPTARLIQVARKRQRGIVDREVPATELPVPGLAVGSTIAFPIPA